MDSFEINKILGAFLGTCLCLLSLNIAAGAMFSPPKPAKPGFEIAVTESSQGAAAGAPARAGADREAAGQRRRRTGETAAKKCAACHTFGKGEPQPRRAQPVGHRRARARSVPDFNYSAAMKSQGRQLDDRRAQRLPDQSEGFVPGTNMTLPASARQRAGRRIAFSTRVGQPGAAAEGGRSGAGAHAVETEPATR